jgi:hypothetical protein
MAYKSQVTNKYMGSSFAGRVNPGNENSLTQLVKTLRETDRAVSNAVPKYKEKQIEKAEEQLEYLKTTMSPEELNAYILEGNDPILSNKWATSVVEGNVGRFQAGEAIAKIRAGMGDYDYEKQTLREFYAPQIPDMSSKSSAYKNGFSVAFNNWSTGEYMKDADMRGKKAEENKVNNVVKFMDNTVTDMDDYWETLNSFNSQLPNTAGQENKYMTNDQLNDAALQHAKFLVQSATSVEHFDKAMTILNSDRGVGKNGQQLGSLIGTKREDVGALVSAISAERYRFEDREIKKQDYQDQEDIKNLFVQAFVDTDLNDDEALNKLRKQIQIIDPASVATFDRLNDLERDAMAGEGAKSAFLLSIARGDYNDDIGKMIKDFEAGQYPRSMLNQTLSVWGDSHRRSQTGEDPIYFNNKTYSNGTDLINASIAKSFTGLGGLLSENYKEAVRNSTFYIQSSILEFEAEGDKTNNDRRIFMQELGDYVSKMFVDKNVTDPSFADFTTVQEVSDLDTNAVVSGLEQTLPQFDMFELINTNLGDINRLDEEAVANATNQILQEQVYPQIAQAVIDQLPANVAENAAQFFAAMPEMQYNDLAIAMGLTYKQLYDAMAQYFASQQ